MDASPLRYFWGKQDFSRVGMPGIGVEQLALVAFLAGTPDSEVSNFLLSVSELTKAHHS